MKAIKKQQRKAENLNEELTDIVQGQRYKEVVPKNNGADINLTLTLNTGFYLYSYHGYKYTRKKQNV